jgi:hypothetical protein
LGLLLGNRSDVGKLPAALQLLSPSDSNKVRVNTVSSLQSDFLRGFHGQDRFILNQYFLSFWLPKLNELKLLKDHGVSYWAPYHLGGLGLESSTPDWTTLLSDRQSRLCRYLWHNPQNQSSLFSLSSVDRTASSKLFLSAYKKFKERDSEISKFARIPPVVNLWDEVQSIYLASEYLRGVTLDKDFSSENDVEKDNKVRLEYWIESRRHAWKKCITLGNNYYTPYANYHYPLQGRWFRHHIGNIEVNQPYLDLRFLSIPALSSDLSNNIRVKLQQKAIRFDSNFVDSIRVSTNDKESIKKPSCELPNELVDHVFSFLSVSPSYMALGNRQKLVDNTGCMYADMGVSVSDFYD